MSQVIPYLDSLPNLADLSINQRVFVSQNILRFLERKNRSEIQLAVNYLADKLYVFRRRNDQSRYQHYKFLHTLVENFMLFGIDLRQWN